MKKCVKLVITKNSFIRFPYFPSSSSPLVSTAVY